MQWLGLNSQNSLLALAHKQAKMSERSVDRGHKQVTGAHMAAICLLSSCSSTAEMSGLRVLASK